MITQIGFTAFIVSCGVAVGVIILLAMAALLSQIAREHDIAESYACALSDAAPFGEWQAHGKFCERANQLYQQRMRNNSRK